MSPIAIALIALPMLQSAPPVEREAAFARHVSLEDALDEGAAEDDAAVFVDDDNRYAEEGWADEGGAYEREQYDREEYEWIDEGGRTGAVDAPSATMLGTGALLGGSGAAVGATVGTCMAAAPACILGALTQGWGTLILLPLLPFCGALGAAIGGSLAMITDFSWLSLVQAGLPVGVAVGMSALAAVTAVSMGLAVGFGGGGLAGGLIVGFAMLFGMTFLTAVATGGVHMAIGFGRMAFAAADENGDRRAEPTRGRRPRYSQAAPVRSEAMSF